MNQDDGDRKIVWTDEEREQLAHRMLSNLSADPNSQYVLNAHHVLQAQYQILPQDRWRTQIQKNTVQDMQGRLNTIRAKQVLKENETIVASWHAYTKSHGRTPIAHAMELAQQVTELNRLLEAATRPVVTSTIVEKMVERAGDMTKMQEQLLVRVSNPIRLLLVSPRMSKIASNLLESQLKERGVDVEWVGVNDDSVRLKNLAATRHVFMIQGALNSRCAGTLRQYGLSFREVVGGNSAFTSAVTDFVNQQLTT